MAQRRISQLLALSHRHYKPVTSKGHLKGNVWRGKKKVCVWEQPRERLSACLFFFFPAHDITGLRYFGITASQWVIFSSSFTKTTKRNWQ